MSDEVSCACPRCWTALHVEQCGDINCTGQCRNEEGTVVQPLTEEERAEMKALAHTPRGLLTRAERERLVELRHQDIDANDDRIAESIEFPPDEGV